MNAAADLLSIQLHARPMAARDVATRPGPDGGLQLSRPLEVPGWARPLRAMLPLSRERNVQLDDLGATLFRRCDGQHTLADLVDWLAAEWHLSFFEARGLILQFLQPLLRYGMVVIALPAESDR